MTPLEIAGFVAGATLLAWASGWIVGMIYITVRKFSDMI
jgi:hypothetical protein